MKRKYISFDDLPAGTKERFKKKVIPLSLDTTGALKPWVIPDDQTILDIWNLAFIGSEHQFGGGDVESERFVVVKTLVSEAIIILCTLTFYHGPDQACDIYLAPQVRRQR